jgi:hypothetical protein
MGKPVGSDLMQGTLTLPSLLLIERRPDDNPVHQYFEQPQEELLAEAVQAIRANDIPQESYEMARGFCASALKSLSVLPEDPARQASGPHGHALEHRSWRPPEILLPSVTRLASLGWGSDERRPGSPGASSVPPAGRAACSPSGRVGWDDARDAPGCGDLQPPAGGGQRPYGPPSAGFVFFAFTVRKPRSSTPQRSR